MKVSMKIKGTLVAALMAVGSMVGTGLLVPSVAMAGQDCGTKASPGADYNTPGCAVKRGVNSTGANDKANDTCGPSGKEECTLAYRVQQVVNVLLFLIGAVSVIMIILGGIRYVLSNGEASQIAAAKNTILYAVIGLIVSLLAYAIVGFVVEQFTK